MNKLLLPVFLFCMVAVSLVSCTSDDEHQLPNVEAKEMRFIQLDELPSWSDFGENNKKGDDYMEALTRIVDFDGQQVSLRYESAEEAKVSQNLYDDIVALYSNYSSLKCAETRGGVGKPKTDCVASSISAVWAELFPEAASLKDSIKSRAWNMICQLYGDQGVPYEEDGLDMILILSQFFRSVTIVDSMDYEFYYDYKNVDERINVARIAIVKISETDYHCMTVIRSTRKAFYCRDDQNNNKPMFFPAKDVKAVYRLSRPKFPNK